MKKYKRFEEAKFIEYYKMQKNEIDNILDIIITNQKDAFNFFNKIYQYTMENTFVNFNHIDINFYSLLNNKQYKKVNIYRGERFKNPMYKINEIIKYENKNQYSSWTFSKKKAEYFQKGIFGQANGVILQSTLPTNFIDLKFIFSFLIEIYLEIDNLPLPSKFKKLLSNMRPFDEDEVLIFTTIKAKIINIINDI